MSEAAKKALEALESAAKLMTDAELEYYTGRSEGFEAGFARATATVTADKESEADPNAEA